VTVLFYISGHGFGHAVRQVEIINILGRRGHRIVIRSAIAAGLLARTVSVPYELMTGDCDSGIVQSTSIHHDDRATVDAAVRFYETFEERLADELRAIGDAKADLIVGDIPPLAFEVASRLGVPSVAVANFTWDWIYEAHPGFLPAGAPALDVIRTGYRKAGLALALPFATGFDIFPHAVPIPLIARRPRRSRAATRAHFGLPAQGRAALLSFGGYGLPLVDPGLVDCRSDWTIVTTERTIATSAARVAGSAVVVEEASFANGFRYEDLVAAVDVVITKPGYGIMAECIAAGTALLYTSRGQFREYDVLVAAMHRFLRCRFISHAELLGGAWREPLEAVLAQPAPSERIELNGAEIVAEMIEACPEP
jgi:hypothetical protein